MIQIGDTIRDVEDGDCYFEGIATDIVDGKVTKYILTKIIWSGEEDQDDKRLNTEISPEWWYIEPIANGIQYNIKLEREDIENMIGGIYPDYCAFDIPMVKKCGKYIGGMRDEWSWDWSNIKALSIEDLLYLYTMCKISHKQKK